MALKRISQSIILKLIHKLEVIHEIKGKSSLLHQNYKVLISVQIYPNLEKNSLCSPNIHTTA